MPVIGSGTQGCIVRPALNGEPRMVSKIFVTERGLLSQNQEVSSELLEVLERLDPERRQFAYALRRGGSIHAPMEVEECKDLIVQRNSVPRYEILQDIRWFNLDDLQAVPEYFTTAQKDHLRAALALLHDAGYAHNDIQLPNIMMGSDDMPRLIDFGETTAATTERIANDNDRLEAIFRGSVFDINALRRSRISERRRERAEMSSSDDELQQALFQDSPVPPSAKRLHRSLFD